MRDLYEVLGVAREASGADIKRAYRRLAMQYHPDQNPNDPEAEEKFKEASNAYKVLADSEQRARYDRFGFEGLRGTPGGAGFSGMEDIFSAFGDIFGDFFGSAGGRRRAARGADLRVDVQLSFAEAVWGVTKEVNVARMEPCEPCEGSGAKPGTRPQPCSTCGGKGQVVHAQGFFMIQSTCPSCRGQGSIVSEPCPTCRGNGAVEKSSTLTVNIPPGVDHAQTLRLAEKGEASPNGGPPGHLYVVLHVEPDERFVREGDNILTEVPISYVQAALGAEVEVPTLEDGCTASTVIEVKPGAQPGDVIMRRGEGVPRVNRRGRGDHAVQLKVTIPTKLSKRERELLRELAEEGGEEHGEEKKSFFGRLKK